MDIKNLKALVLLVVWIGVSCSGQEKPVYPPPAIPEAAEIPDVKAYITTANGSSKLEYKSEFINGVKDNLDVSLEVDKSTKFQEIDGFGFALTGGSAQHISNMNLDAQTSLLQELFGDTESAIKISYIRISIGASDLNESPFSYNDLPNGQIDIDQINFSLANDQTILIPLLKKILEINPKLQIMASPWSAPTWMKTNNSTIGGALKEEYYESYALYLTKYLEAMKQEGVIISSFTIQNEPLHEGNNPSMGMSWEQQANFIKNHLGPLMESKLIDSKLILYDHNADRPDYPISILNDVDANKYIAGSAFHLYGGNISALSTVHNAHPDKGLYFTEQWYGAPGNFSEDLSWHTREIVIGAIRNWSRIVIEWNLSSNSALTPHTAGGCSLCLGGITIDGDAITRNAGYYVIGHVSKFVGQGSVRINSYSPNNLPNVCFLNENSEVVMLVLNNSESGQEFNVIDGNTKFSAVLDAGSVATFIWKNI